MSNIKIVADDEEFNMLLKAAGDDLVVIDFFTTWCTPCRNMEPVFEQMALRYPKVMFLKVDADKCFDTAMTFNVSTVPFFVIRFNKTLMETVQGANTQELELKIRLAEIEARRAAAELGQSVRVPVTNPVIATYGRLGPVNAFIDNEKSRCYNDLSPSSFHNFLGGKKLVSGKGTGKMLLLYTFTQKIMLQSFKIRASSQTGPKVLRIFVNHPRVLDFNVGQTLAPSQEVTLSPQDLTGERAIELRSGSFQVVNNVQIFVTSGQAKGSKIEIESLQLFGAPIISTQLLNSAVSQIPIPDIPEAVEPATEETTKANNSITEETVAPTENPSSIDHPHQSHAHSKRHHHLETEQLPGHSKNLIEVNQNATSTSTSEKEKHPPSKKPHSIHHHPQHQ